jgi:signal transduction histidine kinase
MGALAQLSAIANAPIYGWLETAVDLGVVGVRSLDVGAISRAGAQAAIRVLRGTPAQEIPILLAGPERILLDARVLRRWNIDPRRVPAGSTILNRQPTAWEQYHWQILGILFISLFKAGLIAALLVQRARRRKAEEQAVRSENALRSSLDQVQDLAGRLITAQEAERARIARDLHDDVNQQIAALSIQLGELQQDLPEHTQAVRSKVEWLRQRSAIIAEAVRSVSHQLHPGILEHAGLIPALRGACADISTEHALHIDVRSTGELSNVPAAIALALYRIAQEALHNIVRHARAQYAAVRLTGHDLAVQLEVTDNGRGFQLEKDHGGLGLLSMKERAGQVGGELHIDSSPGQGTRITVRVPILADLSAVLADPATLSPLRAHGRPSLIQEG